MEAPRKADPTETQIMVGVSVLRQLIRSGLTADEHPYQLQLAVTRIYLAMKEVGG